MLKKTDIMTGKEDGILKDNIRIKSLAIFFVLLATEILIGIYAHGFVRMYIGDVLVIPTISFFLTAILPRQYSKMPLVTLIIACLTEILQGFDIVDRLGLEKGSLLAIIIGSTFDIKDILCYIAGFAVSVLIKRGVIE